jgi:hypothetical protein
MIIAFCFLSSRSALLLLLIHPRALMPCLLSLKVCTSPPPHPSQGTDALSTLAKGLLRIAFHIYDTIRV